MELFFFKSFSKYLKVVFLFYRHISDIDVWTNMSSTKYKLKSQDCVFTVMETDDEDNVNAF